MSETLKSIVCLFDADVEIGFFLFCTDIDTENWHGLLSDDKLLTIK